jgi:putative ABC transport system substrate-binding protein
MIKRREFVAGLGSVAAWPLAARAQQSDRVRRRIGVLMVLYETDPLGQAALSMLTQGLAELGWMDGRNLRIDVRWAGNDLNRMRMFAKELVGLQPDVLLAGNSTPVTAALQRETRTIPIVFVGLGDPVASGLIASLPQPGGNLTGFFNWEASFGGKWLELLMEIAPDLKRVAMIFNPDTAPLVGSHFSPSFEAAARSLKVEPIAAPVHSDAEIETVMTSLGGEPRGGLVVMPDAFTVVHRVPIILLAARNNVPAVYQTSAFVREGGLLSYGPDGADLYRRSASYVNRILRGEKPSALPVQLPVKFEMAVNIKTAKALGLTVPQSILLRADEVIE